MEGIGQPGVDALEYFLCLIYISPTLRLSTVDDPKSSFKIVLYLYR